MNKNEKKHKRRVRYKGTHPRNYKEKYKEHQPELYSETVERVIQKGSTPAGMHLSICVDEILDFLEIKPGEIGLDATLGYGGHSEEMLKVMNSKGKLYATDVDSIELPKTEQRLRDLGYDEDIFEAIQTDFSNIDQIVLKSGPLDFILADLGVSSMQIDNPDRGFSFKYEGPLDLRLDPLKGQSATERLDNILQEELEGMLIENSDEPYAREISTAVVSEIEKGNRIETTTQLKEVISDALKFIPQKDRDLAIKKSCQRSFQALRIDVNDEFEVLYEFLEKLPNSLKSGGRVAILSFHSGEDRLVKKSFKRYFKEGVYKEISSGPIRPTREECNTNSRARSAKLRWVIKA